MSYYRCEKEIIFGTLFTYWYVGDELINTTWERI
tara:strand:+ start:293 stop:394 length:102 start_codon:yes stop_codon:yes gene_type:complete